MRFPESGRFGWGEVVWGYGTGNEAMIPGVGERSPAHPWLPKGRIRGSSPAARPGDRLASSQLNQANDNTERPHTVRHNQEPAVYKARWIQTQGILNASD